MLMLKNIFFISILFWGTVTFATLIQANDEDSYLRNAREIVKQFAGELKANMQEQIKSGGPVTAISFCSQAAPTISSKLSRQTGWVVKRVSLKARNPLHLPDSWERKTLYDFEKELSSLKPIANLEHSEVTEEGEKRYFRYMKVISTTQFCIICHGPKETLAPDIQNLLSQEYPHDAATGYKEGMIRGAFSVKRTLE
jgi:hypothetical protein